MTIYQVQGNPNGQLAGTQGDQAFDTLTTPNNYFVAQGGTVWQTWNTSGTPSGAWQGIVSQQNFVAVSSGGATPAADAPNQCYFAGDFYQAVTATAPGESPASAPAKWAKLQVPASFRWILTQLTYAHLLELDGQTDKAETMRGRALNSEGIGLFDMVRREANREERRLGRPAVQTPYNLNLNGLTGWPNANVAR